MDPEAVAEDKAEGKAWGAGRIGEKVEGWESAGVEEEGDG